MPTSADGLSLRQRAEEVWEKRRTEKASYILTPDEVANLVKETEIRRIEFELQSEEMRVLQQTLEVSRNHYAELFDFAPLGYLLLDEYGHIEDINSTGARFLRRERVKLLSQPFIMFVGEESKSTFMNHVTRCTRATGMVDSEVKLTQAEGPPRVARLQSMPAGLTHDGRRMFRTAMIDMTDHYRALELQTHLAEVVNSAVDGIVTMDVNGTIRTWNAGARALYGYTAGEAIGQSILSLVVPEKLEEMRGLLTLAQGGERVQELETERRAKNGSRLDVSVTIAPLRPLGKITALAEISRDITSRKRWERSIQENETRFRRLADSSPVLIWMSDLDHRCVFVNEAFLDFLGCDRNDPRLEDMYFGVHPEDLEGCAAAYRAAFEARQPFRVDYRLLRSDGKYRWIHDHGVPYTDDQEQFAGFIGSCVDITDLKRTHEELDQAIQARTRELQVAHGGIQAVLDGAPIVLFMGDLRGNITHITGRGIEGMKQPQRLFIEQHKVLCPAAAEYSQAVGGIDARGVIQLQSGHVFEIFYSPHRDRDNTIIGVIGVATDITQRFRAEEERRNLEALCKEIASADNLDQALYSIVEKICNMAIWTYGEAWIPDESGRKLACSSAHWCSEEDRSRIEEFRRVSASLTFRPGEGLPGRAWQGRTAIWTKDLVSAESPLTKRNVLAAQAGFKSAVAIPVTDREDVLAVLVFFLTGHGDMDQGLYNWIQGASAQLALFLRRRIAEDASRRYLKRLRGMADNLGRDEGLERRRIAKGLHDGAGQTLTLAKIKIDELRPRLSAASRKSLQYIRDLVEKSNVEIRSLTFQLSPPILYELGFEPAVAWLGEQMQTDHRLHVNVDYEASSDLLDETLRTTLFECVRELLHNVVKHAGATRVDIVIRRSQGWLRVEIRDNGRGFDIEQISRGSMEKGFGLFNIRERIEFNGGCFSIDSSPGKGTAVSLETPIRIQDPAPDVEH